jgi:Tol biopolymer transport system component
MLRTIFHFTLFVFALMATGIAVAQALGVMRNSHTLIYLEDTPRNRHNTIWMLDIAKGLRYQLLRRSNIQAFELSPDQRTVAYQLGIGTESSIYLLSLTSPLHEMLISGDAECPRWSPDGHTLAYQDYHQMTLFTLDTDSRETERFFYVGSGMTRCSFDWSGDGSALIFSDWHQPDPAQVVSRTFATGEITPLFGISRPQHNLSVSPDGLAVAFNGRPYVNIVDIANREIKNLSYFAYTYALAWSPTQEAIAFGYQREMNTISDGIVRGVAIIDHDGIIRFQQDIGEVIHLAWWSGY